MGNGLKSVPMKRSTRATQDDTEDDIATHVAEVVYHGEKLILPEGMAIPDAIDLLHRRAEYLGETVAITEEYDVFPYDGALALDHVLTAKFGWSPAVPRPGFFGDTPPQLINVRTGPDVTDTARVVWGVFKLPNVEGKLQTGVNRKDGRFYFQLHASIKRKDEATVQEVFRMVRERLQTHSIYRGKAVKIRFMDDDGDPIAMPDPEFIDTRLIKTEQLIYSRAVMNAIDTNLFTPIRRVQDCLANGIHVKRGVLLGGTYGTGKTLAATIAAKHAVDSGITYLYIPRANELAQAIEFAKQYQSPACVIFCEDVDRVMSGERDEHTDEILNLIDGIDTKNCNIIVVLTTNALEEVEPAMLRPGRLDAVIEVTPPDAEAVGNLLRYYGGTSIATDTDLTEASALLAGHIPAVVAEVVNRAKLAQLRLQAPGTALQLLSQEAIIEAASTMRQQLELLHSRIHPTKVEKFSIENAIGEVVKQELSQLMADPAETLQSLDKDMAKLKDRFDL